MSMNAVALFRAARARAAESEFFLAHDLARYASQTGQSDRELAAVLGCAIETLDHLALCRSPHRDDRFRNELEAIARRFQIDGTRLAAILRELDAVAAFEPAPQAKGWLAAARDRDEDDADA